ncbi:MAG: chorismate mutase [Lentisphaeria bacterium]|nr:chorismate mutase [Lentisphaeria bacterium]
MAETLDELRRKIDELDTRIVSLLNERYQTVKKVGAFKKGTAGAIYVPERERKVYEKVCRLNDGPMKDVTLFAIYREIMSGALALEQGLRIAYFGSEGSFTHLAAVTKFGNSVLYRPEQSVKAILQQVVSGECDYGCIPESVLLEGLDTASLDFFRSGKVSICAEICGKAISVSDSASAVPRYFIIGVQNTKETGDDKTSLFFALPDRPGALFDALEPFKDEATSLHIAGSCPIKMDPGSQECRYCFLVDLEGHLNEEKVIRLLSRLKLKTLSLVTLGSYPRGIAPSLEELAAECKKD